MLNLIRAGIYRMFKQKAILACVILSAVSVVIIQRSKGEYWGAQGPLICDFNFLKWLSAVPLFTAVMTALFCASDYDAGAIKNKLAVGLTKAQVYLSNFVVCFFGSLICFASGIAVSAVNAVFMHQIWLSSPAQTLGIILMSSIIIALSTAITLIFSMLIRRPAVAVTLALTFFLFLGVFSSIASDILKYPGYQVHFKPGYGIIMEPGSGMQNPLFINIILSLFVYFTPYGGAELIYSSTDAAMMQTTAEFPLLGALSQTAATAVLLAVGTYVFRKKNVN